MCAEPATSNDNGSEFAKCANDNAMFANMVQYLQMLGGFARSYVVRSANAPFVKHYFFIRFFGIPMETYKGFRWLPHCGCFFSMLFQKT